MLHTFPFSLYKYSPFPSSLLSLSVLFSTTTTNTTTTSTITITIQPPFKKPQSLSPFTLSPTARLHSSATPCLDMSKWRCWSFQGHVYLHLTTTLPRT
ncbi:hypothetical protein E2C01_096813 [Portunus trituberculatus]|uniref:Uncharacterized protein n=1 Tax=Portunus trituberculatus TaxID=210409 RepID=A0A5B7JYU2_PORTR|nr:hypothetical protein [Portunus trituberculatus]